MESLGWSQRSGAPYVTQSSQFQPSPAKPSKRWYRDCLRYMKEDSQYCPDL